MGFGSVLKMADEKRSQMMASVPTSGTKPELLVREALLAAGVSIASVRVIPDVREEELPGKPDIVLPGRKAVIFVP